MALWGQLELDQSMPRRKPISAKQRKAELQLKRAVKRGDVEATAIANEQAAERRKKRHTKGRTPTGSAKSVPGPSIIGAGNIGISTRRLESRFLKLDKGWLEHAKLVAATTVLVRPIPENMQVLNVHAFSASSAGGIGAIETTLSAPRRPKWRYDQSKKEVEKNEEGLFLKWLRETDDIVERWQTEPLSVTQSPVSVDHETNVEDPNKLSLFKRSPTWFERNLEVWRQLWRVTEISQILLILLDSRAPTLHFPSSMQQYIQSMRPTPPLVLVLTKVDLITPARAKAWTEFLTAQHPTARIVQVESYKEREGILNDGRAGKKFLDPHIPTGFLAQLVDALKAAYTDLLTPPPNTKATWKPRVREGVDWERILADNTPNGDGRTDTAAIIPKANEPSTISVTDSSVDKIPLSPHGHADSTASGGEEEPFITIGLIGQPNVGKSSLLNALFGTKKVKASKTPGKTKHFQTLFWTPEIRLVDCPGLVFPGLVPMELQVLAGVLPISQMPSIPSCVQFVCERMPLERILGLEHPGGDKPVEDKRTWRAGMKNASEQPGTSTWTAIDVLTAYATKNGWLTAKAGRPDIQRAGNALLRACADGKNIRWGFRPPSTQNMDGGAVIEDGIWIRGGHHDGPGTWDDADESGEDEDVTEDEQGELESSEPIEEESEDDSEDLSQDSGAAFSVARGRFGALSLVDNDASSEDS